MQFNLSRTRFLVATRMRDKLRMLCAASILLILPAATASAQTTQPAPEPGPADESKAGAVTISFAPKIDATKAINMTKAVLNINGVKADIQGITDGITADLTQKVQAIKDCTSDWLPGGSAFKQAVTDISNQAQQKINAGSTALQKKIDGGVNDAVNGLVEKANAVGQAVSPAAKISGRYKYHWHHYAPGDPGWSDPLNSEVAGAWKQISGTGGVSYDASFSANIEPAGVGITISVPIQFAATVSATAAATVGVPNADQPTQPSTNVSCDVGVDVSPKVEITAKAGYGVTLGASVTTPFPLPRVSGSLIAGEFK